MPLVRLRVRLPTPSPGITLFTTSLIFSFLDRLAFFCPSWPVLERAAAVPLESVTGLSSAFSFLVLGSSSGWVGVGVTVESMSRLSPATISPFGPTGICDLRATGMLPGADPAGSVAGGSVSGAGLGASGRASSFSWSVSISDRSASGIGGLSV